MNTQAMENDTLVEQVAENIQDTTAVNTMVEGVKKLATTPVSDWLPDLMKEYLVPFGIKLVASIVVLLLGRLVIKLIKKWMKIYTENMLSRGEYLNLYTWGYDYPEAHVIRQNGAMYYSFYVDPAAPQGAEAVSSEEKVEVPVPSYSGKLELRGLDPGKTYTAVEYAADEPREFVVDGANPVIEVAFERSYLLKLTEN